MAGDNTSPTGQTVRIGIAPWTWPGRWWGSLTVGFFLLAALGWLLARLLFLPSFFGLFFFLVAGLLVGSVLFRTARPIRPAAAPTLLAGLGLLAACDLYVVVFWESKHVRNTIADLPLFSDARNAAVAAGRNASSVQDHAKQAMDEALSKGYPPGGTLGYVRWAVATGEMNLTVDGFTEQVSVDHRGWKWVARTIVAWALLLLGLWSSCESLRSPLPVSNLLAPGEEAEDMD